MYRFLAVATAVFVLLSGPTVGETRLAMAEETGCIWCARWNSEIAPIYPISPEGIAAPLLRFDKSEPLPDGIVLARPVVYTPTFILLIDGEEINRLEGYPGEDFFWGLLGMMLKDASP
ncbi:hypothetical protein LOM8899_03068 [Flavimaricola marinus]|uniref:Regulatory protein SoxS n=2 Tax=Flavimaricola marinus TaxID=1819565 RepID=A0A238LGU0_9RHOB|nr:hypothetical protein LOM8899_03068 [Flavimaricola marinus]